MGLFLVNLVHKVNKVSGKKYIEQGECTFGIANLIGDSSDSSFVL